VRAIAWGIGQTMDDRGQRTEDKKRIYRDKAGRARKDLEESLLATGY
jgi:hypothetical protein